MNSNGWKTYVWTKFNSCPLKSERQSTKLVLQGVSTLSSSGSSGDNSLSMSVFLKAGWPRPTLLEKMCKDFTFSLSLEQSYQKVNLYTLSTPKRGILLWFCAYVTIMYVFVCMSVGKNCNESNFSGVFKGPHLVLLHLSSMSEL